MLFGLFALLTGAAVFAILWPLAKKPRAAADKAAPDVAFYKAKLAEIERETASDLLSKPEAEAARTEAARRLLRAADATDTSSDKVKPKTGAALFRLRFVAVLALTAVPALALGLYTYLGHPSLPDEPLAARLDVPPQRMTIDAAIAKVEAHLLQDPNDGRGYEVLVPAYLGVGRIDDAVRAAGLAMQKLGATPGRKTIYGETLVYSANGVVTEAARKLFQEAASADPPPLKSLFFLGLAAVQDGDKAKALGYWDKLLPMLPQNSSARADLVSRIATLEGKPAPELSQAAAIASLAPTAQAAAIHGMIDRLAARLAQNGHDIEGWLRLVRAYKVVNELDKARAALATARHDFDGDAQATARLDALARELGLDT